MWYDSAYTTVLMRDSPWSVFPVLFYCGCLIYRTNNDITITSNIEVINFALKNCPLIGAKTKMYANVQLTIQILQCNFWDIQVKEVPSIFKCLLNVSMVQHIHYANILTRERGLILCLKWKHFPLPNVWTSNLGFMENSLLEH